MTDKITQETVEKVANLAKVRVSDDEKDMLITKMNEILNWVGMLDEVNTDDVEPMTSVTDAAAMLRKDEITDGNQVDAVLENAPDKDHGFFLVPKVVE